MVYSVLVVLPSALSLLTLVEGKYEQSLDEVVSILLGTQEADESPNRSGALKKMEETVEKLLCAELSPILAQKRGVRYFVDLFKTYDSWEVCTPKTFLTMPELSSSIFRPPSSI